MQNVAESRRNMKVDLRPAVVAKTMTKELILVSVTLVAVISQYCVFIYLYVGLPLYFLKIRPILQRYQDQSEKNMEKKVLKEEEDNRKKKVAYAKENYRNDIHMTTSEKAMRLSPEQME